MPTRTLWLPIKPYCEGAWESRAVGLDDHEAGIDFSVKDADPHHLRRPRPAGVGILDFLSGGQVGALVANSKPSRTEIYEFPVESYWNRFQKGELDPSRSHMAPFSSPFCSAS